MSDFPVKRDTTGAGDAVRRLRSALFGRKPLDVHMDEAADCLRTIIERADVPEQTKVAAAGVLQRIDAQQQAVAMHLHKTEMVDEASKDGRATVLLIKGVSINEV